MHYPLTPNVAKRLKEVRCSFKAWGGAPYLSSCSFFNDENSLCLNVRTCFLKAPGDMVVHCQFAPRFLCVDHVIEVIVLKVFN